MGAMIFIIIILLIVIITVVGHFVSETEPVKDEPAIPASRYAAASEKATPNFHRFDENDPEEILQLANLLTTLVSNGQGDCVLARLQDENPSKGTHREMNILAFGVQIDKNNLLGSITRYGIPEEDARYLASVPFEIKEESLSYTFKVTPPFPSSYRSMIISEMKDGASNTHYWPTRSYQIKEYPIIVSIDF